MDGSTSLAQVPGIAAVAGSGEESLYSRYAADFFSQGSLRSAAACLYPADPIGFRGIGWGTGQLRDSGLRSGYGRSANHHGGAAQQLYGRRIEGLPGFHLRTGRDLPDNPRAARDCGNYAGADEVVGAWLLHLHQHWPGPAGVAVGGRPYPAAGAGAGLVALARRGVDLK